MVEFVQFVRDAFGVSAFELVVVGLLVIGLVVLGLAARQFGLVEAVTHRERELRLLGEFLLENAVLIAEGQDIDLSTYETRAAERAEAGLQYIDPRMLMLLDKADDYVSERTGFDVSFDALYAKAETVYQRYKASQPQ